MTSPAVRRELTQSNDRRLLAELQARNKPDIPEPTVPEILETYEYLRQYYQAWRTAANEERERRYLKDQLPKRMQAEQIDGRRFYTRLSHNEIMKVVSQQTDNPPRFIVPAAGDRNEDKEKAQKQTRWANNLLAALQRQGGSRRNANLRRRLVDTQNEIGLAALEVFLTGSYDGIVAEPQPDETPAQTLERLDRITRQRKLPFGIRVVDGLNLLLDEDDDYGKIAMIAEQKPWAMVHRRYKDKLKDGVVAFSPSPGAAGFAMDQVISQPTGVDTVPTIRYYDDRYYCYIVNGVAVDGPREHNLPGNPVFPLYGPVTGAANLEQSIQGICWGMGPSEVALNDIITIMIDTMWKTRQPKFVIETSADGRLIPDEANPERAAVLDLSNLEEVQQLNPGQVLKNAHENWEPWFQLPLVNLLFSVWGRSAQNPIAQGESPGADTAGYTVATLSDNATTPYKDNVLNEANLWANVMDYIRLLIRDTIKVPTPLTVPLQNKRKVGVEWLALGEDDITEVPTICTIDPNSDAHRLANRQSLMEGNQAGYLPRREVQTKAFGAEDPEAWDDEIVIDGMRERLAQLAVEGVLQEAQLLQQPPNPYAQGGGGPGAPLPGPGGGPAVPSGGPPPPQAPQVGAAQASASRQFQGAARGGEDNGYVPRNVRE